MAIPKSFRPDTATGSMPKSFVPDNAVQKPFKYEVPVTAEDQKAKVARLQMEAEEAKKEANKASSVLGFASNFGKELVKNIAPSEVSLGNTISGIIGTNKYSDTYSKNINDLTTTQVSLQKLIRKNESEGKDTTKLKKIYNDTVDLIEKNKKDLGELTAPTQKTGLQVAGELGGTAIDLLSAGSYGKSTTGMQTGALAPRLDTLPTAVQEVRNLASRPAGILTKTGLARVGEGIGFGYGVDVSRNLQEGKTGLGAMSPGLGTVIGGAIPSTIGGVQSTKTLVKTIKEMRGTSFIGKEVSNLLSKSTAISKKVNDLEARGVNVTEQISDPNVYKGLKVQNRKIIPDEAVDTLDNKINTAMEAKRATLPELDRFVPKQSKEALRERAYANVKGKYTPADEQDIMRAIDQQIDALPDEMSLSELDAFRARARESSRNAKGIQKRNSEYSSLENASRDMVFDATDNLPFDTNKEYTALNVYIKNLIATKEFVDKGLRGQVVKGGFLGRYMARGVGAIVGSKAGPLGALMGSEVGGFVSDILANNQLGNSIKLKLIKEVTDDPAIIKQAEELLNKAKDYKFPQLPAPKPGSPDVQIDVPMRTVPPTTYEPKASNIQHSDTIKKPRLPMLRGKGENPIQLPMRNISRQKTENNITIISAKNPISDTIQPEGYVSQGIREGKEIFDKAKKVTIPIINKQKQYVQEFIKMPPGSKIDNPNELIKLTENAQISRQSLKHFVESRQKQNLPESEITYLVEKAPEVITKPEITFANPKQDRYPGSTFTGRFYTDKNKAVMVLLDKEQQVRDIISIHFKNRRDFEELLKIYESK